MTKALFVTHTTTVDDPVENDLGLRVNADGSKSFRLTTSFNEATAQRLRTRLRFFFGEWFMDRRLGVPYIRDVLGQRIATTDTQTTLFRTVILETPGVATLVELEVDIQSNRKAFISFLAILTDGSVIDNRNDPFLVEA